MCPFVCVFICLNVYNILHVRKTYNFISSLYPYLLKYHLKAATWNDLQKRFEKDFTNCV